MAPPHCDDVASELADGLFASCNLGACWEQPGLAGGLPPASSSLFYLLEEVIEPGPEDVDISVGRAMLHLLGDE